MKKKSKYVPGIVKRILDAKMTWLMTCWRGSMWTVFFRAGKKLVARTMAGEFATTRELMLRIKRQSKVVYS